MSSVALGAPAPTVSHVHTITRAATPQALTSPSSFANVLLGDRVELTIALQDGSPVEVELERFNPFTPDARIVSVNGTGAEQSIDLSNDVHLRGHVTGDESQVVYIGVTRFGTSGMLEIANQTHVISTGKFNTDPRTAADLSVFPADLLDLQPVGQNCAVDINNPMFNPLGRQINNDFIGFDGTSAPQGERPPRDARVAIETDFEFTSWLFGGDTTASASYASTLIGAISTIYSRDVNMTLSIPFLRTYETNNDPYGGDDIIVFLEDVQAEFNSGDEADIDRAVVQGLSARNLGGGVAWLPGACNDFYGIGVSANLDGFFPNPLQNNSYNNWDVIVAAHEMGHNFGTGHTHEHFTPVIDGCGNGDCSLSQDATIMSYCHLCPGGLSNIDLRFHPRVQDRILSYLNNDADCDLVVNQCEADLVADGSLNFLDISAFLAEFAAQASSADWNGDTDLNFLDISAFIADFAEGCP